MQRGNPDVHVSSNNHRQIAQLIECFLLLNDSPSDAQVHSLSHALAIDVEELEAIVYRMLGRHVQEDLEIDIRSVYNRIRASVLSDDQKVLVDDYDPNLSSDDEIILNDSVIAPDDQYNLQEYLTDDGEPVDEVEVSLQDLLTDDSFIH